MGPMDHLQDRGFVGGGEGSQTSGSSHFGNSLSWQASEYIHHDKGAAWVVVLVVVAAVGVGLAVWFGQWMFAFLLTVMSVAFGYYAVRQPRTIRYELNHDSLTIDSKPYHLSDFSAFGVIAEGALYTVRLIPAKRFAPAIMIYFAKEDGEQIVDILGSQLPMEEMQPDFIDTLMRKLRF